MVVRVVLECIAWYGTVMGVLSTGCVARAAALCYNAGDVLTSYHRGTPAGDIRSV